MTAFLEPSHDRREGYNRFRLAMSGGGEIRFDCQASLEGVMHLIDQRTSFIPIVSSGPAREALAYANPNLIASVTYVGARVMS